MAGQHHEEPAGGQAREGSRPSTKEVLPAEAALKEIEKRKLLKALRREGEPVSPAGAYEPKQVEVYGSVMKFHCRCGKRISAPVDAKKTVGRCPKCGSRLVLPRPSGASAEDERAARLRAAVSDAADRLRGAPGSSAQSPGPRPRLIGDGARAPAAVPAALARLVAFQIDAAAVWGTFLALGFAMSSLGAGEASWFLAGALAGAVWGANRIVLPMLVSASAGMLLVGLRFRRPSGGRMTYPVALARAMLGVALLPLAPLALLDAACRTPADRIAGTVVAPTGQAAPPAREGGA